MPVVLESGHSINNHVKLGWNNRITSVSAASASYSSAQNVLNGSTSEKWIATTNETSVIQFDFTATVTGGNEYVALNGHNLHSGNYAKVSLQSSSDGVTYSDIVADYIPSINDDSPIIFYFASKTHAYFRLLIESTDIVSSEFAEAPFIANLYAGNFLEMPRRIYAGFTPINYAGSTKTFGGSSESGEFLGRKVLSRKLETQLDFQFIDQAWFRSTFYPFMKSAEENPFFLIWRGEDYPEEVAFCQTTRDISVNNAHNNRRVDIGIRIEAHHSGWLL